MKYMIMLFGDHQSDFDSKPKEWIAEMHQLMMSTDSQLRKSGELVSGEGLADPSKAKTVRSRNGTPVATDGPYAEAKESLVGYWVVDVKSEARAIDIVSQVVAFTNWPMEIRQVMDSSPQE
ncbi:MAG: YciI family protein [Candidatus Dormibacteraceae bacterium]